MASINNPELTVTTDRPDDRAIVIASCDVDSPTSKSTR